MNKVKRSRRKFLKKLKDLRQGKIDLDKVPVPGISGSLKGSSADGELIKITDSAIYVKCMSVLKNHKLQDKICEKCQWHSHPDRAKGKMLCCKMH